MGINNMMNLRWIWIVWGIAAVAAIAVAAVGADKTTLWIIWSIAAVAILVGMYGSEIWKKVVWWRWSRDPTQQRLYELLIRGGGAADRIYDLIVEEKRWDRPYAAKRLMHALALVELRGASPAAIKDAFDTVQTVNNRLWGRRRTLG